jgi:hypothetical protein
MEFDALMPEQLEDLAITYFLPDQSLNFSVGSSLFITPTHIINRPLLLSALHLGQPH